MIKMLQRKFVTTAMIAISILFVVLIGSINIFNILTIKQSSEELLYLLSQNEQRTNSFSIEYFENQFMGKIPDSMLLNRNDINISKNEQMAAIYFIVRENTAENLITINIDRIASINEEEAMYLYNTVSKKDATQGRIDNYRYQVVTTQVGKSYVFLDITTQMNTILQILLSSTLCGILGWVAMFFLVSFLSKKAIEPIAVNMEKQKQFITNAGHEIKTPLAIIQTNTEALELRVGETKWSKNIRTQISRMTDLTQNLLTLAKLDEQSEISMDTIELSPLILERITEYKEVAYSKEIQIEHSIEQNVCITGNLMYIQNLISILMDNAMKYTNEKGHIIVNLLKVRNHVCFSIKNTCDDLESIHVENLFDRFYQNDTSHSKNGFGIGLSAAQSIVTIHGGQIEANKNDSMIEFKVTFKCKNK